MTIANDKFQIRMLTAKDDLDEVYRLRHRVFVREMGARAVNVGAANQEADAFDAFSRHLTLWDRSRDVGDQLVGTYRIMDRQAANRAGGFYCEAEYDLSKVLGASDAVLELGRSCIHADYRGSAAILHLWDALKNLIAHEQIDYLFGVASFPGTDCSSIADALSLLHHEFRAAQNIRPISRAPVKMDLKSPQELDRKLAILQMPTLIKAYLRNKALVGEGAYIDHQFNTIDICMVMRTADNLAQQGPTK